MATAQEIIEAGLAQSAAAAPGATVGLGSELLDELRRALGSYYLLAAKLNPRYFGRRAEVSLSTATADLPAGWVRPAAAVAVTRLESVSLTKAGAVAIAAGTTVTPVPVDDRRAFRGDPCVYEWGGRYITAGNASDPVAGTLAVFYAGAAVLPDALDDELDPTWPREFDELLILDVARYAAAKDDRQTDLATFDTRRTGWLELFTATVEGTTTATARRHPGGG